MGMLKQVPEGSRPSKNHTISIIYIYGIFWIHCIIMVFYPKVSTVFYKNLDLFGTAGLIMRQGLRSKNDESISGVTFLS